MEIMEKNNIIDNSTIKAIEQPFPASQVSPVELTEFAAPIYWIRN